MTSFVYTGWVEQDGVRLSPAEVEKIVLTEPDRIRMFGGEFSLSWGACQARDHFGILPGPGPKGTLFCEGKVRCLIEPDPAPCTLEDAIVTAVRLRSDEGIMALSGGVDSSLVAALAQRECVAVGLAGSHDLTRARHAARLLGLSCTEVEITPAEIESVLPAVIAAIPKKDPVNTSIAVTMYFVTRWAGAHGYRRILAGQGADELFGGYARYLSSPNLEDDLARDIAGLEFQAARDQAVAALSGTYLSMPYLDIRVVRAAGKIPAREKVRNGQRKIPLREVAAHYIPQELAGYEKKAMQYGSGVWGELKKLARKNGYKTSVQDYIDHIGRVEHGH
ncbi:asparagine synthase C-terminal domain-containing protein [Methanoregula sp.]|uniref:asparagine synthase C-terminal domain-containing protein n=1 Tax=Methanoregula sp. TaxID=2052170 RepID=UPI002C9934CE|nr:asparagine synthase C-terminal domain-containing protein [Methanoregula sp.]HVP97290.1 asparagine synthase C-terminal domain-containing protein [Methanoregula sp.]